MNKFGTYTKEIISKLPYWFYIRKQNTKSIGAAFLNCFGLELDDIEYMLNYSFEQCYINTADTKQKDIIYRIEIGDELDFNDINTVRTELNTLILAEDLDDFLKRNVEYLRDNKPYDVTKYFKDPVRKIIYLNTPNKVYINEFEYTPVPHHVWNIFDEFGMLLCCPRLYGENNLEYKDRILDVFKNPANSSKKGLLNGVSRELGLRKKIIWIDGSTNLVINDTMILLDTITINDKNIDIDNVFIDYNSNVVLKGNPINEGKNLIVSYISGIQIHEINNILDIEFMNECYNADGTVTPLMKYYIDRINSISPIMWNSFIWDECYWDTCDYSVTGLAFIPSLYDAKIEGV